MSHTGFRLIPSSMTLNDLERRNSPYFTFFTEFDGFAGQLHHSGWRWTYNVCKILSPLTVFHSWPKLTHPAEWSVCDSWATCHFHLGNAGLGVEFHMPWFWSWKSKSCTRVCQIHIKSTTTNIASVIVCNYKTCFISFSSITFILHSCRFVLIWKHFCFILSTGTRIRLHFVMRSRSSSRGRNTSACLSYSYKQLGFHIWPGGGLIPGHTTGYSFQPSSSGPDTIHSFTSISNSSCVCWSSNCI